MRVLITGFDPFAGEKINPSFEAVKLLPNNIEDIEIIKLEVPTVFHKSINLVVEKIQELKPDVVISVGQAGGRFAITPERVAINIDDARIPDNEKNQPLNQSIYENGENAYFTTLPIKTIVYEMQKKKIPASLSNSAGTFVCNHLMYGVLHFINTHKEYQYIKSGFIHIPYLPIQVINKPDTASMNIHDIAKGLLLAIYHSVKSSDNSSLILGSTE